MCTANWEDSDAVPKKSFGFGVQLKASQCAFVAAAAVAAAAVMHYQKETDFAEMTLKVFLYDLAFHLTFLMGGAFGWSASKWAIQRFLIPSDPVLPCPSKPCISEWEDSSGDESSDVNAAEAEWAAGCADAADVVDEAEATMAEPALLEQQPEEQETPSAAADTVAFETGSVMKQLNNGDPDDTTASDLSSERAAEEPPTEEDERSASSSDAGQNAPTAASVKAAGAKGGESKRNETQIGNKEEAKMVLAPEVAALLDTDSEDSDDSNDSDDSDDSFHIATTWSTPNYGYWSSASQSEPAGSHRAPPGLSLQTVTEQPQDEWSVPLDEMACPFKAPASEGCQKRVVQTLDPNASVFQPATSKVCQQFYTDGNQVYMMTATPLGKVVLAETNLPVEPAKIAPVVNPCDPMHKAFTGLTTVAAMCSNSPSHEAGPWAGEGALDDEEDDALWGVCWDFSAA